MEDDVMRCVDCGSDDYWFSREICPCDDMHYYCSDCGAQVDPCRK